MDRRIPAAGQDNQIAGKGGWGAGQALAIRGQGRDLRGLHPPPPQKVDHAVARKQFDAGPADGFGDGAGALRPAIRHHHLRPGFGQIQRRPIAAVIVGEYQGAAARQHGIATDVLANRRCQHDARTVVVGECQRPLASALGKHHLLGSHPPQALPDFCALSGGLIAGQLRCALAGGPIAGQPRRAFAGGNRSAALTFAGRSRIAVVVAAFQQSEKVLIIVAKRRGSGQQRNFRVAGQFRQGPAQPVGRRCAIQALRAEQQAAAQFPLLVGEHHARAGAGGRQGRHQSGWPAPNHQHIAVGVALRIAVRVRQGRRNAQSSRLAQQMLIQLP